MPVSLHSGDDAYNHFNAGYGSRQQPLTDKDRKMLRFSARSFYSPAERDSAIAKRFGMDPVTYYRKLETLKDHPQLGKQTRSRLSNLMSTPGPMTGGAPISQGKQFSHGLDW